VADTVARLHRVAPDQPVFPARAKEILIRWLVRQLYPDHLDLHAYRILLVAATGHASEEVTGLPSTTSSSYRPECG
jgi:hypothetical protein